MCNTKINRWSYPQIRKYNSREIVQNSIELLSISVVLRYVRASITALKIWRISQILAKSIRFSPIRFFSISIFPLNTWKNHVRHEGNIWQVYLKIILFLVNSGKRKKKKIRQKMALNRRHLDCISVNITSKFDLFSQTRCKYGNELGT